MGCINAFGLDPNDSGKTRPKRWFPMGCVKLYITLLLIPMIPMIHDIDNVPKAGISHGISAMAPAALLFLRSGASFLAYAEERLPEKLPK